MAALTRYRLDGGVLVLQSRLWATNSVVVPAGDACLLVDPSIFPDEIEAVRSASSSYGRVYVLVTHSDFDHVCGVPAFPDATIVAGPTTAGAIAAGTARRALDEAQREWRTSWVGSPRVDLVLDGDAVRCGTCDVAAIDARGHGDDGEAFVVAELGLLLPGDYLSAVCHPIVLGSLTSALATHERLLRALGEWSITTVVPGHGPALTRDQARRIAGQDSDYLRALQTAAADVVRAGADAEDAVATVRSVPPPRPARPDFEALGLLAANARAALADAGHPAFARAGESDAGGVRSPVRP